ncbi:hypothetical protein CARUB_v10019604mg [Capsella rubella]|uniref:Uncharacterized protein n=1 Tax=Capsella rubella TaxID=81985 RepID=R0FUE6_9BRAS|nr:uncharacterized protein LOC17887098 [Capsella rubella]EOA26166.1 hypothetical protein CARUB_v10019604mg [Capsella rubella]
MVAEDDDRILWDCGSPLYDSYELVSLTHIIERHFMSLPSLAGTGKMYCSRTPSDLGEKSNRTASAVVDLCCSSDSTARKLMWGVFRTKWWKRAKNAEEVVDDYNKKKKKRMFCRILSGIRVPTPTTRSPSSKM